MDIENGHKKEYGSGYVEGVSERISVNNGKKIQKEKKEFFRRLAAYDAVLNIKREVLSSENKYSDYHKYRQKAEELNREGKHYKKETDLTRTRKSGIK